MKKIRNHKRKKEFQKRNSKRKYSIEELQIIQIKLSILFTTLSILNVILTIILALIKLH